MNTPQSILPPVCVGKFVVPLQHVIISYMYWWARTHPPEVGIRAGDIWKFVSQYAGNVNKPTFYNAVATLRTKNLLRGASRGNDYPYNTPLTLTADLYALIEKELGCRLNTVAWEVWYTIMENILARLDEKA